MQPRHKASAAALELIKRFEGFRAKAAQLPGGGWTIGYGHTQTAREGAAVSPADAEALLLYDLIPVQAAVNDNLFTPLTQNQYDAVVAFAFNVGVDNFRRSTVLRRVNEGNLIQAAGAIEMWRKADLDGQRIVVDALVRRRAAEKMLFLTPAHEDWTPVPSSIVRPRVDYDVGLALPRVSTEVSVALTGPRGEAHPAGAPVSDGSPAVTQAAANVAARLSAIAANPSLFAESEAGIDLDALPAPPPEDADAPPLVAPPAPALSVSLAPPPEPYEEEAASDPEPEAEPAPPPVMAAAIPRPIAHREAIPEPVRDRFVLDRLTLDTPNLLIMGAIGLVVFTGAVVWGLSAKGAGGLLAPLLVAGLLGVVGIGLVAAAVYVLLARLGDREG